MSHETTVPATPREMVARARELRDRLRAEQAATEERTYHSSELFEAFRDAGLYRMLQPRRYGGFEVDLGSFYATIVELARGYLAEPSLTFFCRPNSPPLTGEVFSRLLSARGTHLYSMTFATPDYTPDTVVPQLRKSAESVRELLERSGFSANRIDVCMGKERCVILFELMAGEVPVMRRHIGPPVWSRENAEKFLAKYVQEEVFAGPYVEDGRYVVEIARPFTRAVDLLRSKALFDVALGKHVRRSMKQGWTVKIGAECWDEEFAGFLSAFLERSSPLARIKRVTGR